MIRLWIDDIRPAPDGFDWAVSSDGAIAILEDYRALGWPVEEISFDHDLGGDDTSRRIVIWMIENDYPWPAIVRVHSANPVGIDWLNGMISRYGPGVTR